MPRGRRDPIGGRSRSFQSAWSWLFGRTAPTSAIGLFLPGKRTRTCLRSVYDTLKQRTNSLEVQIVTRIPTLRESRSGTDRCVALQENLKCPSYCDHHFTGQWLPPLGVCCTRPLKRARRAERARRRNSENNLLLFIGTSTKASEPVYV